LRQKKTTRRLKITSIIFDLGGVLYDIDTQRTAEAFARLGVEGFEEVYSLKHQAHLVDELETGKTGREEFCLRIRQITGITADDAAIEKAWNALLIGMPEENIGLLKEVGRHYRIFLLSNTNEMHLAHIDREMQERGIARLEDLFEKAFYSFRMGLRKPGVEIYTEVLRQAGIRGEETLFIDDNAANVAGAAAAGIHAMLKDRYQSAKDFLVENGLI
jgi:putative hydrolase of the HAD superfamily